MRGAGLAIECDEGGVRCVRACGGTEDGEELEHSKEKKAMIINGNAIYGEDLGTILENNRRAIEFGKLQVLSVGQDSVYWPLTSDRPDHAHSTRSHTTINLQVPLGHTLEG